jgi:hypothetical protein
MVSANQLRGVQAEATLVLLMEKQLAIRREQTKALRRCVLRLSPIWGQAPGCTCANANGTAVNARV